MRGRRLQAWRGTPAQLPRATRPDWPAPSRSTPSFRRAWDPPLEGVKHEKSRHCWRPAAPPRPVGGAGGAGGPPQFDVHGGGSTYLSLSFLRNSGYIVSGPPSTASTGMLRFSVSSFTNGFFPGK